jgi:GrpB-like predicted nucleotidyltransferase (UPF0157 family)
MNVVIHAYDELWRERFEAERERIDRALSGIDHAVEHVGSTSVEGLAAKPIVDMLIGVGTSDELDRAIGPMLLLDYYYIKFWENVEGGFPDRRFFVKLTTPAPGIERVIDDPKMPRPSEDRTHHVHLVVRGTDFWHRHLRFRDILRSNADVRTEYEKLKRRLAAQDWQSSNDYANAKTEFIEGVLARSDGF